MFHFIRIPKNASRSVKATELFICSNHIPVTVLEEKYASTWKDDVKFCITRNPFDRLVSAYCCGKKFADQKQFPYFNLFNKYDSFEDFCTDDENQFMFGTVRRQANRKKKRGAMVVHPHFQTQCYWIKNKKGSIDIDYIIRFEYLNDDWEEFLFAYEFEYIGLDHINSSQHCDWKQYYNPEIAERIYKIYEEDFLQLGYGKDSYKE